MISEPLLYATAPIAGVIMVRSGVLLERTAAEALAAAYEALFDAGGPMNPWPAFLPEPAVTRDLQRELAACMAELGWTVDA